MYLHKVPSHVGILKVESSLLPSSGMGPHQLLCKSASLCNSSAQRNAFSTYTQRQGWMCGGGLHSIPIWLVLLHSLAEMSQLVNGRGMIG